MMIFTIWLASAMVSLAAIPVNLLVPVKGSPVDAAAGISGYFVLAKMVSPGQFRLGKLLLSWDQFKADKTSRDQITINLEGLIYSGSVSCPSKGTLLQVDLIEGSADVGIQKIGVGAGASAVRIDWDCSVQSEQLYKPSVRSWEYYYPELFKVAL
jgi:hypothetical protein